MGWAILKIMRRIKGDYISHGKLGDWEGKGKVRQGKTNDCTKGVGMS